MHSTSKRHGHGWDTSIKTVMRGDRSLSAGGRAYPRRGGVWGPGTPGGGGGGGRGAGALGGAAGGGGGGGGGAGQANHEIIERRELFPESMYWFTHAIIQEVAYNSLLRQQRQMFHVTVGEALEALYAERHTEQAAELAHHYWEGAHWSKARDYSALAGDRPSRPTPMPKPRRTMRGPSRRRSWPQIRHRGRWPASTPTTARP